MRTDLIKQANDLNRRLQAELIPSWTTAEQGVLTKVSSQGYKMAKEAKKTLVAEVAFLLRNVQDPGAKRHLKSLLDAAQEAEVALNQVGYAARRAYDLSW